MSITDDDMVSNVSGNETIHEVVEARLLATRPDRWQCRRRRRVERRRRASRCSARCRAGRARRSRAAAQASAIGFTSIPPSSADTVVVAPGYTARVLIAWGDPVSDGPAYKQDASNSAADQAEQWGMHNDGFVYFPIRRSSREGLIVQNSEYTDDGLLFPDGQANWTAEKTAKSINAHGVNIIHVRRGRGRDDDVGGRAAVAVRPPDHWPDADGDRRPARRRQSGRSHEDVRRPGRHDGARHTQQLRHGAHAVGHVPRLRGELQQLLPQERPANRGRATLWHQCRRRRLPVAHDRHPLPHR